MRLVLALLVQVSIFFPIVLISLPSSEFLVTLQFRHFCTLTRKSIEEKTNVLWK